jgi:hypothetical protein
MTKTRILFSALAFAVATLVSACDRNGRVTPFHFDHTGDFNLTVPDSSVIEGIDLPYPTGVPVG